MADPLRPTWTLRLPPVHVEVALLAGDASLVALPMRTRPDTELDGSDSLFVSARPGRLALWRGPQQGIHPDVLHLRVRAQGSGCRITTRWRAHPYVRRTAWWGLPFGLAIVGFPLHLTQGLIQVDPWLWWTMWVVIMLGVHRFVHQVHEAGRREVLRRVRARFAPYLV